MVDNSLDDLLSHLNSQMTNLKSTAPLSQGACFHCKQPIVGSLVEASGRRYHPEHFVCFSCRRSLHGIDYYEPDGQVHCTDCYQKQLPSCAKCGRKILERAVTLNEINKAWHPEHFSCAKCGENLEGKDFYTHNDLPYCPKDYHAEHAPPCVACKKGIQGELVTTQNKLHYHPACFVCSASGCGKKLAKIPYYEHNNTVYCEVHYNSIALLRCPCGETIQGQYVSALGKTWHADHFVCSNCKKPLLGGGFAENNGKAYCEACDSKLFP